MALPLATAFEQELLLEFPRFRIREKHTSNVCWMLHWALILVTLGGQREFRTGYYTVLGDTLYVPPSWATLGDRDRVILLRHERVHLRQRRRYGTIGMAFLYLLPIFPLGLAYGRARLEWEAYAETLRATAELVGVEAATSEQLRTRIVSRFIGPAYGWMWPFRRQVEAWYAQVISEILAGKETSRSRR